jgi:hypothetical protein
MSSKQEEVREQVQLVVGQGRGIGDCGQAPGRKSWSRLSSPIIPAARAHSAFLLTLRRLRRLEGVGGAELSRPVRHVLAYVANKVAQQSASWLTGAAFGTRSCLRLPDASAYQPLEPRHIGLVFDMGARPGRRRPRALGAARWRPVVAWAGGAAAPVQCRRSKEAVGRHCLCSY